MENFVLRNTPISTGIVVIINSDRDILKKFNSWKTLVLSNMMGVTIFSIKGMVIKDKQAVIAVKETDKATFASINLDI